MNLRSCPPGLDIGLINQRAKGFLMSDLKWKKQTSTLKVIDPTGTGNPTKHRLAVKLCKTK